MNKNVLITIIIVVVLVAGALLWIWNSEMGQPVVIQNAPVPQASQGANLGAVIDSSLDAVQVEDPAGDFKSADKAAGGL